MAHINGNEVLDAIIIKSGTTPTGTINITENGEYNVAEYGTANVNVDTYEAEINAAYAAIIGEVA